MSSVTQTKEEKKLQKLTTAGESFSKVCQGQKFYVANLKILDDNGNVDLPQESLKTVGEALRNSSAETTFMLVTVSNNKAKVHVSLPETGSEITEEEWLNSTSMKGSLEVDLEKGQFLKFRDNVINEAIAFLQSKNLLKDDESEEEYYTFDD